MYAFANSFSRAESSGLEIRAGREEAVQQLTGYFMSMGSTAAEAHQQAIGWIGRKIAAQSSFLAYIDLFWVLMMMALATIPLAFTLRGSALGSGPAMLD